jgi:hypothetical protein
LMPRGTVLLKLSATPLHHILQLLPKGIQDLLHLGFLLL